MIRLLRDRETEQFHVARASWLIEMVKVRKSDGTLQEFDREKLERSLLKARANSAAILEIIESLTRTISDGMETTEIRRRVWQELSRLDPEAATRYESFRRVIA